MNKFKVINNATTLINNDFIIDPWIYGNLYCNAWSPYPEPKFPKKNLKLIKHCFISHLHQDHWDLETIKYFDKKVNFYLPNVIFIKVIEVKLKEYGFKNINYIDMGKFNQISKKYSINIVPPLNRYALETDKVDEKDEKAIAIDTGLIVKTLNDNSNHLLLSDNSPYDYEIYKKYFNTINIASCFFPYNSYADDYPLCYDNFHISQKRKISMKRNLKREEYLLEFLKKIKPKILIPYSSDFSLNLRKNETYKIRSSVFLDKYLYSKRIQGFTKIRSVALYEDDDLFYNGKMFSIRIRSNFKSRTRIRKKIKLTIPKCNKKNNLTDLMSNSLENCLKRINKYKLNYREISKWKLLVRLSKSSQFLFDFKKASVIKLKNKFPNKKNLLVLNTSKNIFQCILEGKLHMNNCQIGCYLSWERYPNKFSLNLNNSINFLHI